MVVDEGGEFRLLRDTGAPFSHCLWRYGGRRPLTTLLCSALVMKRYVCLRSLPLDVWWYSVAGVFGPPRPQRQ